jgi:hypothetical protein
VTRRRGPSSSRPNGTFIDPFLPQPLPREEIAGYVATFLTTFPDLTFEYESISTCENRVIAPWRMKGTNTGDMPGLPGPTGRTIDLPGMDAITVGPDGIISAIDYSDQITFFKQLGLQVQILPADKTATNLTATRSRTLRNFFEPLRYRPPAI